MSGNLYFYRESLFSIGTRLADMGFTPKRPGNMNPGSSPFNIRLP